MLNNCAIQAPWSLKFWLKLHMMQNDVQHNKVLKFNMLQVTECLLNYFCFFKSKKWTKISKSKVLAVLSFLLKTIISPRVINNQARLHTDLCIHLLSRYIYISPNYAWIGNKFYVFFITYLFYFKSLLGKQRRQAWVYNISWCLLMNQPFSRITIRTLL